MSGEMRPKIRLGKKRRTMRIRVKPNRSKPARSRAKPSGRMPRRTLKPSSGGKGNKLKRARATFKNTPVEKREERKEKRESLRTNKLLKRKRRAKKIAMRILVTGPARAVRAVSFFGSRKLKGSIGTGLAAPKMMPAPEIIRIKGKTIVIRGSMWGRGSRVSRLDNLAVGSPSRSATKP